MAKRFDVLHELVEQGNTVVIGQNLEVIKTADWVIDLDPDGGGEIVAAGTPQDIVKKSYTGQFLRLCSRVRRSGRSGSRRRSNIAESKDDIQL